MKTAVSNILDTYTQLDTAYSKKTLKLLQSKYSQIYLALFRTLFPDASQGMEAEELWARMDECLFDLQEAGFADILPKEGGTTKRGRAVCHDLIDRYNWVESRVLQNGTIEYRLTSDAIEALDIVERLRASETVMTGSRMRTILDQIDRTYVRLSPDYQTRLRILQQRVADALDELDAYEASGGKQDISPEDARDEIANLIDLMSGIPVDLRRLEEDLRTNASSLIARFRDDERPTGQIIGDYLREGRELLETTEHGRSFLDSVAVIGNTSLSGDVDSKLDAIAEAPVLEDSPWEHIRRIQDGWNQVANGVVWVNKENSRSAHAVNRSIGRHDVARDRELSRTLKELEAAAYAWSSEVGPRVAGPIVPSAQPLSAKALRDKPYVPSIPTPPPPLEEGSYETTISLEELRRIGGPLTRELLDDIASALPINATHADLANGFNALPASKRRPVELAGILQLATNLGLDLTRCEKTSYECVGLDGRTTFWKGPRVIITVAQMDESRKGLL